MKPTRRRTHRAARRLFRLCLVDGVPDEGRVRTVATRIAKSRRRGTLAVLARFYRLVKLDRNRHSASVESAVPLTDGLRDEVRSGLTRVYGSGVAVDFVVTPALIGGVRIRIGSDVYDGSVRTRLTELEARF